MIAFPIARRVLAIVTGAVLAGSGLLTGCVSDDSRPTLGGTIAPSSVPLNSGSDTIDDLIALLDQADEVPFTAEYDVLTAEAATSVRVIVNPPLPLELASGGEAPSLPAEFWGPGAAKEMRQRSTAGFERSTTERGGQQVECVAFVGSVDVFCVGADSVLSYAHWAGDEYSLVSYQQRP